MDRTSLDFDQESMRIAGAVDALFSQLLDPPGDPRDRLFAAMRHAAIGGGKKLRPLIVVAASRLFAIDEQRSIRVGASIEAIHVYSLIHDDLPAMDDDDLRRGRPTVHKASFLLISHPCKAALKYFSPVQSVVIPGLLLLS